MFTFISKSAASLVAPPLGDASFFFASPTRTLVALGARETITEPGLEGRGLAAHVAARLASHSEAGVERPIVIGALPFDETKPARLLVPETYESGGPSSPLEPLPSAPLSKGPPRFLPESRAFLRGVEEALERIESGTVHKVVLSRRMEIALSQPIDIPRLLQRLQKQNPRGYTFALDISEPHATDFNPRSRVLVGASPELLVSKSGSRVLSQPLAGSAARSGDPREDERRAKALLASEKDLREHAIVVDSVASALAPFCKHLRVPPSPSLVSTPTMWHLASEITGELVDPSTSSLELAQALHPTPAVCGYPKERARAAIASIEPFDRGFFTGMVGYCDAAGDGEWAVTIRCADITDDTLRLYAGAGIVAGSDPDRELDEIAAKLRTMQNALGLDMTREAV